MRDWARDRSLGILFVTIFLVSWVGQLFVEWLDYVHEQSAHGEAAVFWSEAFWVTFGQSTLENWQSEFLQLSAFTIACAYLVYKGSSESPDGEQRLEAKLDVLLERYGVDPAEIERTLPPKYRRRRTEGSPQISSSAKS
ncbi:MAG TPA: DUF6766 family protein [Gaiellaceae bacterium]|nr:DUF6766 family protein [Gaiellaceae bacterium]